MSDTSEIARSVEHANRVAASGHEKAMEFALNAHRTALAQFTAQVVDAMRDIGLAKPIKVILGAGKKEWFQTIVLERYRGMQLDPQQLARQVMAELGPSVTRHLR